MLYDLLPTVRDDWLGSLMHRFQMLPHAVLRIFDRFLLFAKDLEANHLLQHRKVSSMYGD
jgi:hypothetical protein